MTDRILELEGKLLKAEVRAEYERKCAAAAEQRLRDVIRQKADIAGQSPPPALHQSHDWSASQRPPLAWRPRSVHSSYSGPGDPEKESPGRQPMFSHAVLHSGVVHRGGPRSLGASGSRRGCKPRYTDDSGSICSSHLGGKGSSTPNLGAAKQSDVSGIGDAEEQEDTCVELDKRAHGPKLWRPELCRAGATGADQQVGMNTRKVLGDSAMHSTVSEDGWDSYSLCASEEGASLSFYSHPQDSVALQAWHRHHPHHQADKLASRPALSMVAEQSQSPRSPSNTPSQLAATLEALHQLVSDVEGHIQGTMLADTYTSFSAGDADWNQASAQTGVRLSLHAAPVKGSAVASVSELKLHLRRRLKELQDQVVRAQLQDAPWSGPQPHPATAAAKGGDELEDGAQTTSQGFSSLNPLYEVRRSGSIHSSLDTEATRRKLRWSFDKAPQDCAESSSYVKNAEECSEGSVAPAYYRNLVAELARYRQAFRREQGASAKLRESLQVEKREWERKYASLRQQLTVGKGQDNDQHHVNPMFEEHDVMVGSPTHAHRHVVDASCQCNGVLATEEADAPPCLSDAFGSCFQAKAVPQSHVNPLVLPMPSHVRHATSSPGATSMVKEQPRAGGSLMQFQVLEDDLSEVNGLGAMVLPEQLPVPLACCTCMRTPPLAQASASASGSGSGKGAEGTKRSCLFFSGTGFHRGKEWDGSMFYLPSMLDSITPRNLPWLVLGAILHTAKKYLLEDW